MKHGRGALPPALLLSISFHSGSRVLGREGGVPLAIFPCLGADLHEPGRRVVDALTPVKRRHAPFCAISAIVFTTAILHECNSSGVYT